MKSRYIIRVANRNGGADIKQIFGTETCVYDVSVISDFRYCGVYRTFIPTNYTMFMDLMELKCTTRTIGHNCIDMWMERVSCILGKFYSIYKKYYSLYRRYL